MKNNNLYIIYPERIYPPDTYYNTSNSPLIQDEIKSHEIYEEIQQKISKYGKCELVFDTECIHHLESWKTFLSHDISYHIKQIDSTLLIKNIELNSI